MRRRALVLGMIGTLALATAGVAQTSPTWQMATEYPATAIVGEGLDHFAAEVARRLDGRLIVRTAFGSELGVRSAEMPAAVAAGKVQGGDAFGGALGSVSPIFGLSSLPFLATSLSDARRLAGAGRHAYESAFAERGLKLLYVTPWPPSGIWSKAPLKAAQDLAGLPIRTYDAPSTEVLKAAGAQAANLSFADVMPKLKDGSITAVLSSGDGGAGRRLWEFLPHFTEVNYAVPLSFAFVARSAYDALPAADRKAVDEAAKATEERQWTALVGRLEKNYAQMRQNGVTIAAAPASLLDALKQAAAPVVSGWGETAGAAGQGALKAYREGR